MYIYLADADAAVASAAAGHRDIFICSLTTQLLRRSCGEEQALVLIAVVGVVLRCLLPDLPQWACEYKHLMPHMPS